MKMHDAAYQERQAFIAILGGKIDPEINRQVKIEMAKQQLGEKYLLHPANQVQRRVDLELSI